MFVTEGPVDPESPLFVGRSRELNQMEAWLTSVRCVGAVMGARQTGKTSLLLKLRHLLREKYAFVFIDLEAVAGADMGECVEYIASEITAQLPTAADRQEIRLPEKPHEFQAFLERCARSAPGVRIVVLLDEIGALMPETTLRLTSAIRAVFTNRHVKPELARYVFVIAGATDMLEIATGRNSPLKNVAETLYVGDLAVSDTGRLVAEMFGAEAPPSSETLVERVHGWTGGHPYWTQRLGEALHREAAGLTETAVKGAVEQLLLTEDRNLPHIFRALEADQTLTNLVNELVGGAPVPFTRADRAIARLELIGLAKNDGGRCVIRNRIYQEALERRIPPHARVLERDLRHLTGYLLEADDVDTLFQAVAVRLRTSLQNESVLVLRRRATDGCYVAACGVGVPADAANGLHFRATPLVSTLIGPAEPRNMALSENEADLFTRLNISLLVPARLKGTTEALFCLGRRASGEEFDAEDREFLSAVGAQTAMCLDRLRLRMWEHEARDAWLIQKGLLPDQLPCVAGFQIAGSLRPARMVGGDYYDAFELGDRALALCVGDVAGKGMPAALLMASLQAAVRALSSEAVSPSHLCGRINQLIARNVAPGKFITFFFGILDLATRRLIYTNAGHNPPILFSGTNDVVRLSEGGPILGVFPEHLYKDGTVTLQPGDRLLLFTDGVTEAWNDKDEEFGDDRLIALAEACSDATLLHQRVIDSVTTFSGGDFRDDVTVLALTC